MLARVLVWDVLGGGGCRCRDNFEVNQGRGRIRGPAPIYTKRSMAAAWRRLRRPPGLWPSAWRRVGWCGWEDGVMTRAVRTDRRTDACGPLWGAAERGWWGMLPMAQPAGKEEGQKVGRELGRPGLQADLHSRHLTKPASGSSDPQGRRTAPELQRGGTHRAGSVGLCSAGAGGNAGPSPPGSSQRITSHNRTRQATR